MGFKVSQKDLQMKFSKPKDIIYSSESGRTPYDILCSGNIKGKKFEVYINNKFGDLYSKDRNDVTTYNNLLRLYLGIPKQRLTSKITIDKELINKRVSGEEIVAYGVFVFDKNKRGSNFFLLEEVKDTFYINPRNTMFQIKYKPKLLNMPRDFYSFCVSLIDSAIIALKKNLNDTKTEIIVLSKIKEEILKMKK